ncbi:MAG: AAA family ATPase [Actinomycetaceae bacterium]|nr:AAA family ATPase [Actinomycetaceae bacterium]
MFAYALLFRPTLFLIDEPDSHLHPSLQQTLVKTFNVITKELECRIIITTHSRHMIAAAPEKSTRVVWLKHGKVASPDAQEFSPILLDLGALDTFDPEAKMVFYTEDATGSPLREALKEIDSVNPLSYDGVKNAPQVSLMSALLRALDRDASIVIHRDRDCLTDEEIDKWSRPYTEAGIHVFVPKRADSESYYCTPQYLANALGISESRARSDLQECIQQNQDELKEKFYSKRAEANRQFWKNGGSPLSEDLWNAWYSDGSMRHIYGKGLFKYLKGHYRNNSKRDRLGKQSSPELVGELRAFLAQISEH